MTTPQLIVFATLIGTLGLFIWGRWRYDVVGMLALMTLVVAGIVPAREAFQGFGEPAVITVAAVLVISKALEKTGLVNVLVGLLGRVGQSLPLQILAMCGVVAFLSSFMNNVGALALMLPVAITLARKAGRSAGTVLMPLAFASLLGGMTTLIGTPPNLIISNQRQELLGAPYGMFSYFPVGAAVAVAGIAYLALLGWRFLPRREAGTITGELYRMADYMTEVRVPDGSSLVGQTVQALGERVKGVRVVSVLRGEGEKLFPLPNLHLQAGDVLIIEASADQLAELVQDKALTLIGNEKITPAQLAADDVVVSEVVVSALSPIVGQSVVDLRLRERFDVNLLAVSRQGQRLRGRLTDIGFRAGDVLLLQGSPEHTETAVQTLGALPLRERPINLGSADSGKMLLTAGLFVGAIIISTLGLLPTTISFTIAALAMLLLKLINLRDVYSSIEFPILVLLATLIPVGNALTSTGGANLIADGILGLSSGWPVMLTLILVMVVVMTLSDVINNAAAALITAPIVIKLAQGLGSNPDAFLMAVALAASSAFLTPIGHQSNTLVMGPGGYKFGDYWKVGLPLEILVIAVGAPAIALFWGL